LRRPRPQRPSNGTSPWRTTDGRGAGVAPPLQARRRGAARRTYRGRRGDPPHHLPAPVRARGRPLPPVPRAQPRPPLAPPHHALRARYLDRPPSQIDRFRQGGSQALVYGLDTVGARFLKEKLGSPVGSTDWKSRNRTYTRDNLDHTLAVSTFLINLELACRARGDVKLIPFEKLLERAPEKTRLSPMPGRWPVQVQVNGSRAQIYIQPDAIFALQFKKDGQTVRSHFFLEMDRGTMTIAPAESVRRSEAFLYRATLLRKFLAYAESWRQKQQLEHLGMASARVLFATPTGSRADALHATADELGERFGDLPGALFLFVSTESIREPRGRDDGDGSVNGLVRLLIPVA
jgi:hypothetical protein